MFAIGCELVTGRIVQDNLLLAFGQVEEEDGLRFVVRSCIGPLLIDQLAFRGSKAIVIAGLYRQQDQPGFQPIEVDIDGRDFCLLVLVVFFNDGRFSVFVFCLLLCFLFLFKRYRIILG